MIDIPGGSFPQKKSLRERRSLRRLKGLSTNANISRREYSRSRRWSEEFHPAVLPIHEKPVLTLTAEEVVGIITMEDVIEQLLKVQKSSLFFLFLFHPLNTLIDLFDIFCRRRSMMKQITMMKLFRQIIMMR